MLGATESGRVLVTGAAGMLGSQLLLDVPSGFEAVGTDRNPAPAGGPAVTAVGVDLTDEGAVARLFEEHGPFAGVIHPAAYTAVDRAEEEPDLARAVNAEAARIVAARCAAEGIPMVLVSTDFVFSGDSTEPYTEEVEPDPQSVYGATKLEGERLAFEAWPKGVAVVRTQWLYGPRGGHFPATMLKLAEDRDSLKVVHDQIGSPTSTLELAPALWDVLLRGEHGVYHAGCEGRGSWFDLAVATLELAGVEGVSVAPCTTDEFPRPAARPAFSVLDCSKLARLRGAPLAPWRDALATYLAAEAAAASNS